MTLPSSLPSERLVIATVLYEPPMLDRALALTPEHFHDPFHALIWKSILDLSREGKVCTPQFIESTFGSNQLFLQNRPYFLDLHEAVSFYGPEVETEAMVIRDMATRRRLIRIADSARAAAIGAGEGYINPADLLSQMDDDLEEVRAAAGGPADHHDFCSTGLDALDNAGKAAALRIPTGFETVDAKLGGGLSPGSVTILAAGTSVGKSAFSICVALNAVAAGTTVGYFALEMPRHDITMRGGCFLAYSKNKPDNLRYTDISNGQASESAAVRLRRIFEEQTYKRLYLDDRGGLKVSQLSDRYRSWAHEARKNGVERPRLIVVDNLGNLTPERAGDRTDETGRISKSLLAFAKRHDVALLVLHHLNRESIKDERKPKLHDLRQSGEIEQDATAVLFLYRESHFAKQAMDAAKNHDEWEKASNRWMETRNAAEIIIAKNRNGPLDTVPLACDIASNAFWTPFSNVTPIWERAQ
jgi:replicative DNA helicase